MDTSRHGGYTQEELLIPTNTSTQVSRQKDTVLNIRKTYSCNQSDALSLRPKLFT